MVVSWRCIGVFTNLRFMQTICPVFLPFDRMLSPSRITVLNANLRSGRTGTSPYLVTRKIADSLDLCHRGFTIARSAAFHLKSQSLSILLLRTCAHTSVLRTSRQLLASKCLPSDSHCSDPDKVAYSFAPLRRQLQVNRTGVMCGETGSSLSNWLTPWNLLIREAHFSTNAAKRL